MLPEILSFANLPGCPSGHSKFVRRGRYVRKDDGVVVQKYRCRDCGSYFSDATSDPCFRQKKRTRNRFVFASLVSLGSQRRIARLAPLNRKTVVRKMLFFAKYAESRFFRYNSSLPQAKTFEFDDLETSIHTKLKPVSVTLAVESGSRRILGFEVSKMPAKGKLAELSVKKYGPRPDDRPKARERLFTKLRTLVEPTAVIKSDQNPHYPNDVKRFFPKAQHVTFKGRNPRAAGQGELKKGGRDPLFSLNHTCAMLRANINRLLRKTWCTSKRLDRLHCHIQIYAMFHNEFLVPKK